MQFGNKYFVLKVQDIEKHLTPDEQVVLQELANKIKLGRKLNHQKINSYIVVNMDEEYAMIVSELVSIGESQKRLQEERKNENEKRRKQHDYRRRTT